MEMLIFIELEVFCAHTSLLCSLTDIFLPRDVFIVSFEMPPAYPSPAIALLHLSSLCSTIVDSLTQRQQIQTPLMSPCPVVVVYKEQEKPTCFRTPNLQSGLEPLFLLIENTGTVS